MSNVVTVMVLNLCALHIIFLNFCYCKVDFKYIYIYIYIIFFFLLIASFVLSLFHHLEENYLIIYIYIYIY